MKIITQSIHVSFFYILYTLSLVYIHIQLLPPSPCLAEGLAEGLTKDSQTAKPHTSSAYVLSNKASHRHSSFSSAKRYLKDIYKYIPTSFYCGCPLKMPYAHVEKCSLWQNYAFYEPKTTVEFDHLYPMQRLKERLQHKIGPLMRSMCPTLGRKCLTKKIKLFAHFESDMFNIRPVVKKLNRLRGSKWFNFAEMLASSSKATYKCSISFQDKTFSPPPQTRGDIARMMLYLHEAYATYELFSSQEITTFKQWHKQDPMAEKEGYIIRQIAKKQGVRTDQFTGLKDARLPIHKLHKPQPTHTLRRIVPH
ncbi:MAG: endonuclease [Proteobacteria bacterium]|nr:endonuclease [Pseudomonadota bacterium]